MSSKKKLVILLFIVIGVISNIWILRYIKFKQESKKIKLSYDLISDKKDLFQVFYTSVNNEWNEENSVVQEYKKVNNSQKMEYDIPLETKFLRLDFGNVEKKLKVINLEIEFNGNIKKIDLEKNENIILNNEIRINKNSNFEIVGKDPYIILNSEKLELDEFLKLGLFVSPFERTVKIIFCLVIDLLLLLMLLRSKKLLDMKNFLLDLYLKRRLILSLAINDFKQKYTSSYLGLFWSFVQPLINIGVFWFVFSIGFRAADIEKGIPFILWLICGLIPWYYFSEVLSSGTNVLYEYSYMLKQMVFKPIILPSIKILSSLITHLFFCVLIILIGLVYKLPVSLHILQVFYYLICMMYLLFGICLLFSSLKVFLPDVGEIVGVILQLGIWITPIMWNLKMVPERLQWIFKINPMYYVITGYKDTFIYKIWFWERPNQMLIFFSISTFLLVIGVVVFRKLRPHFNDVL